MAETLREEHWWQREYNDLVDPITYVIVILFIITVFQNITFLGDPDPDVALLAIRSLGIALLCIAGMATKTFFDSVGLTKTEARKMSRNDLYAILFQTMIVFIIQVLIFFLILFIPIQSVFAAGIQLFAFAVISSTSEEFFFSYALQPLITKYAKFAGVFVVAGVFMLYHWAIYSSTLLTLFMMFVLRMIYGTAYYSWRRLSPLILAHLITNFFGAAGLA